MSKRFRVSFIITHEQANTVFAAADCCAGRLQFWANSDYQ
jgi:hypothetical protein